MGERDASPLFYGEKLFGERALEGPVRLVNGPARRWGRDHLRSMDDLNAPYDGLFHFARIRFAAGGGARGFGGWGRRGGAMWAHDYPRADRNFLAILRETTFVATAPTASNVITLDDPELFKYPVAYIVEPGFWNPSDEEVEAALLAEEAEDVAGWVYHPYAPRGLSGACFACGGCGCIGGVGSEPVAGVAVRGVFASCPAFGEAGADVRCLVVQCLLLVGVEVPV